jgi:hypothetical protein
MKTQWEIFFKTFSGPGMVRATQEAKIGGSPVQGWSLAKSVRPYLKTNPKQLGSGGPCL